MTARLFPIVLLAAALAACARPPAPPTTTEPRGAVLVDTLRADRVGAYGYAQARIEAPRPDGFRFVF